MSSIGLLLGHSLQDNHHTSGSRIFGVPLDELVERDGTWTILLGSSLGSPLIVPKFIDTIIHAMQRTGMFIRLLIPRRLLRLSTDMKIPGIFRQTGNHKKVVQIAETITNNPSYSNVIFREASGVVLAAIFKKFLRELPEPLLTVKLSHRFIAAASESI